jgi:hypothetical protein
MLLKFLNEPSPFLLNYPVVEKFLCERKVAAYALDRHAPVSCNTHDGVVWELVWVKQFVAEIAISFATITAMFLGCDVWSIAGSNQV